jgi:hypothetical protein
VETYRSSTTNTKDQHRKKYKGKPRNKLHKISKYLLKGQTLLSSLAKHLNFLGKSKLLPIFSLLRKKKIN